MADGVAGREDEMHALGEFDVALDRLELGIGVRGPRQKLLGLAARLCGLGREAEV